MTEAEEALLALVMTPEFRDKAPGPVIVAMKAVAAERLPEGFDEELRSAVITARAAQRAVDDIGRQHPLVCYGEGGLIAKLHQEHG